MSSSDWIEQQDDQGNTYYYNTATQESSWEAPEGFASKPGAEGEWIKQTDENGTVYYYNTVSGESSWEVPPGFESESTEDLQKWSKLYDPSSSSWYYYNNHNGEYQWEKPDDFEEDSSSQKLPENLLAIIKIQSRFRAKVSRRKARVQRALNQGDAKEETKTKWVATLDPSSGYYYYYNQETEECLWDRPADYDGPPVPDGPSGNDEDPVNDQATKTDSNQNPEVNNDEDANNSNAESSIKNETSIDESESSGVFSGELHKKIRAATMMQCAFRIRRAKNTVRAQRGALANTDDSLWTECLDPATGCYYYYNSETEECTWDKPKELQNKEEADGADQKDNADDENQTKWEAVLDPESGEHYYYNKETEEVTWEKPDELLTDDEKKKKEEEEAAKAELPEWVEVFDPSSSSYYYFNNFTNESTWDKPEGFEKPDLTTIKNLFSPELKAAVMLQCAWRARKARGEVRAQRGAQADTGEGEEWSAILDPTSGDHYYYNRTTEEVTWDKPRELMTEEEILEAENTPEWLSAQDEESGQTYYYNTKTGEVQWEKPEGFQQSDNQDRAEELMQKMQMALEGKLRKLDPEIIAKMKKAREEEQKAKEKLDGPRWCEAYDEASEQFYYYNVDTHETVWEKPENFIMEASDELLHAALKVQSLFRAKLAKRKVQQEKGEQAKSLPENKGKLWVSVKEKDDRTFYYNVDTAKISWELTDEMVAENMSREQEEQGGKVDVASADEGENIIVEAAQTIVVEDSENIESAIPPEAKEISEESVAADTVPQKVVASPETTEVKKTEEPVVDEVAQAEPVVDEVAQAAELERLNKEKEEMEKEMERIQKEKAEKKMLTRKQKTMEMKRKEIERERAIKERQLQKLESDRAEILAKRTKLREEKEAKRLERIEAKAEAVEAYRERKQRKKQAEIERREAEVESRRLAEISKAEQKKIQEEENEIKRKAQLKSYQKLVEQSQNKIEADRSDFRSFISSVTIQLSNGEAQNGSLDSPNKEIETESIWNIVSNNMFPGKVDEASLLSAIEQEVENFQSKPGLTSQILRNENGETLLHIAATLGNLALIKFLLQVDESVLKNITNIPSKKIIDVNAIDNSAKETTPLHEVARSGWGEEIIQELISSAASVEATDFHGDTPLHCAVRCGHKHTVKALLKADMDLHSLTTLNDKHRTPLDLARMYATRDMLKKSGDNPRSGIVELLESYMSTVKTDSRKFYHKQKKRRQVSANRTSSSLLQYSNSTKVIKKKGKNSQKLKVDSSPTIPISEKKQSSPALPAKKLRTMKTVSRLKRVKRSKTAGTKKLLPISPKKKLTGLRKLKTLSAIGKK